MGETGDIISTRAILRDVLTRKIGRNPAFSLRALARDLNVSHTYLSLVLNGKKSLSLKRAIQFSQLLGLDRREMDLFLESARAEANGRMLQKLNVAPESGRARAKSARQQRYFELESDRFHILTDWYHLPILDLTLTEGFKPDPKWIASRLKITPEQALDGVERLKRLGLLEERDGTLVKTNRMLMARPKKPDGSVRAYHKKMISMALEALESGDARDWAARDINGFVIPVDVTRIPEAKRRISKFCVSMMDFLSSGESTELFQLNLQLFPLTDYRGPAPVSERVLKVAKAPPKGEK